MASKSQLTNDNKHFQALNQTDTLLIAVGNSSRSDDGLGWLFADQLEETGVFKGEIKCCYQLQIEDAEMISRYAKVVFVDACVTSLADGFEWEKTIPINDFTFTTHAMTPEAVLFLCNDLYQIFPEAYTLKIQGVEWELKPGLSTLAKENFAKAFRFFKGE